MNTIDWIKHVRKALLRCAALALALALIAGLGLVSSGAPSAYAASAARSSASTAIDTPPPPPEEPGLPNNLPPLPNNPGDWWEVWVSVNGQYWLNDYQLCLDQGGYSYPINWSGGEPSYGITATYEAVGCHG